MDKAPLSQTNIGNSLTWRGAGLTDVGKVRSTNQDTFAIDNQLGLWVVADGMGGHAGGGIASQLATDSVVAHIRVTLAEGHNSPSFRKRAMEELREAIRSGHSAVRGTADQQSELRGMGTTLVVALLLSPDPSPMIALAHVGDSRAYLIRSQSLMPLTRDHSLVEDLLVRGLIACDEALNHPRRNVLVRAVGIDGQAEPDLSTHTLQRGDTLVLCTDGLTKMLDAPEILDLVVSANGSPEVACRKLVDAANSRGGIDNITTIVVART